MVDKYQTGNFHNSSDIFNWYKKYSCGLVLTTSSARSSLGCIIKIVLYCRYSFVYHAKIPLFVNIRRYIFSITNTDYRLGTKSPDDKNTLLT
jgi:hypothetical protein